MNILETSQSQVGQNFASQSTRADDEDFDLIPQEILYLSICCIVSAPALYHLE